MDSRSVKEDVLERQVVSLYQRIDELEATLAEYQDTEQRDHELMLEKKEKHVALRLARYNALFELSPEQARLIGEWEWEEHQAWQEFFSKGKQPSDDRPKLEERIMPILSPEQQEVYQAHLEEQAINSAELSAQARLSNYPVTLNLTDDQRNGLFQNLFYMIHADTREQFKDRQKELEMEGIYIPQNISLIMAAEGVLEPEQLKLLLEVSRKE